jgi:hypothetical protein
VGGAGQGGTQVRAVVLVGGGAGGGGGSVVVVSVLMSAGLWRDSM